LLTATSLTPLLPPARKFDADIAIHAEMRVSLFTNMLLLLAPRDTRYAAARCCREMARRYACLLLLKRYARR